VILVGEQKMVPRLGTRVSVPVEVVPFAVPVVKRRLEKELEGTVRLRLDGAGGVFVSDNGNHILDAAIERIEEPSAIVRRIDGIPGVVDNGLFIGMADLVLVQSETGFRRLSRA
jgi:ribose 5-phosphate isomerase A